MVFDRSKYKKVSVETIDEDLKKAQATMKMPGSQGGRASFYSVNQEGRYELRVLPAPEGYRPYLSCKTVKLPIMCPIYDKDGKDTGKKEVRMKDVFTADVHSDVMEGKDAVLTYINYVIEASKEIQDNEERKKFLAPINGYFNRQKQWVWGIQPILNYVCYIYVEDEIYRLNIRPQWWKKMKSISSERSDQVINIDIFSDLDEGYPLIINTTLNEKGKAQFDISCGLPEKRESWEDFFERTRIPDDILAILDELPTLEKQYSNVFSRRDWDLQIEGLERFDEANGYNIFQNEEFLNDLEEIDKLVPDDNEERTSFKKDSKPAPRVASRKRDEEEEKPSKKTSSSSYPSLVKMKAELTEYIEQEYEGTEKLPSNLSVAELREWYDMMKEGKMLPFDDDEENNDDENREVPEEQEEERPSSIRRDKVSSKPSSSVSDRLANLRNRMRK